jgi:tRNA(Arg) A34 adenosine deaminase TadA
MPISRRSLLAASISTLGCTTSTGAADRASALVQAAAQLPAAERTRHEAHMRLALAEARKNPQWPFGAVIVDEASGAVLASGANNSSHNPTLHGEMVALEDYVQRHGNTGWNNATLYTTGEPCPMCMSAIVWAGIPRVVWASSIASLMRAGIGQINISAAEVAAAAGFYRPQQLIGGVLAAQTDPLFQNRTR